MTTYSATWFDTFLPADDPPSVDREVAFVLQHLPRPDHRRVLDVACGVGRHARALASLGYEILGVDSSEAALAAARDGAPAGATFLQHDMRDLDGLGQSDFDAVLCLWQSFGALGQEGNRAVLASMARRLRPGGRLLLDVYHRDALVRLPAEEREVRQGREVRTIRALDGDTYRVRLTYSDSEDRDVFEWQVFTPDALAAEGALCGLSPLLACAWFDADIPASPEHVRMQLLFERNAVAPGAEVTGEGDSEPTRA